MNNNDDYVGVKFHTVFLRHESPQDLRLHELAGWTHRLAGLGALAPAMRNHGFVSVVRTIETAGERIEEMLHNL